MPKYNVNVRMRDGDGAFLLIGSVIRELKKAGVNRDDIDEYVRQITSGDYYNMLKVTRETVNLYK